MARKRKTRAAELPQEPEIVQPAEPDPQPEPGPEPEVKAEVEPEETEQIVGEGDGEEEGEGGEEEVVEEEEEEEELEKQPDNMEELKEEDIPERNQSRGETQNKIKEEPSENTVSENGSGGCAEGEDEEGEEEFEEEPVEKLLEPFSKDQLTLLIKEALGKHPDLAEIVHRMADSDPAHCKIFVHGLGWDANAETITSVFGKYGEIEDCKVVRDKNTGKSKGYGFILFKHRDGARRALKEPQKLIEGRMTSCQLASSGPVQTPAQTQAATVSVPPASEYTQRKIYVSNVSAELEPKKLLEYFSKFGEIEEGPLGLDKQTGKPRGFCLFVYKSIESARKALDEPHKHFEGQILHCQKAVDGPKHSKGYFNQQHGQPQQQQPQQQQQHHHQGHQGYYQHPAKKGRYAGSGGVGHTGGHLMAPSAGPAVPSVGFNPAVAPAALGQAVAALLATQGAGMGIGNLLGGMNPQGVPPIMNNAGYGGQGAGGGYGGQPGMQGGYGGPPQMGQGGVRPHQGGAPYMGHGH